MCIEYVFRLIVQFDDLNLGAYSHWHYVSTLQDWKEPVALLYGVSAVPQNILVGAKGVIVAKNLRGEDLLNKLATLL